MNTISVTQKDKVAFITLDRGRSNAMNAEMCAELQTIFAAIEQDAQTPGVVLTGKENFFCAGLDLIELYDYNETQIDDFWREFIRLTSQLIAFKKPFIAAVNGHAPAAGCVLALCADYRIAADGKGLIGLNEVPIGIALPESIFQLFSFWIGTATANRFTLEGKLLSSAEALQAGLVDQVVHPAGILTASERQMAVYRRMNPAVWQQTKLNIRRPLIEASKTNEEETLRATLKQWWQPSTRLMIETIIRNLKG
jgi:Delta3-Delta2-enoyl-CoA isomerase